MPTQRPATIRLRTSLFQDAVEIVEREYASDLSLDDIARRVASSRRQLQRAYAEIGEHDVPRPPDRACACSGRRDARHAAA